MRMGARAMRSWRESVKRVGAGEWEQLDLFNVLAKIDGTDAATPNWLVEKYPNGVGDRYQEIVDFCETYNEPGTKIGVLPW
jgi:hypothetical protein